MKSKSQKLVELNSSPFKYASRLLHSDVIPYEIIRWTTDKCIEIREMDAVITPESNKALQESFVPGGFCGTFDNQLQEWVCTPNENEDKIKIRQRNDGSWYDKNNNKYKLYEKPYKFYDYNY